MNRPLVSVVMSVYNEERCLNDSIDSILNQTLADFELIIVNDGSTDKTKNILTDYSKIDNRIKLVSNPKNLGIAKSRNIGIKKAEGKYIAIMDAGDLAHHQRLEKETKYLEARDDLFILGTQGRWIDMDDKAIGIWKMPLRIDSNALYKTGGAIDPSTMVRRDLFDVVGLYNETLVMSLEFDLYMRTLKKGLKMENLEDELIRLRERSNGMTLKHLKTIQKNQLKIKIKYLPDFFGFWNVMYTIRSFGGYLVPSFILDEIVKYRRRKL